MLCNSLPLAVLLFLPLTEGLADVTDVVVSGEAGGVGSVYARCEFDGCEDNGFGKDYDFEAFQLGGSNNQVGIFQSSGSVVADGRVTVSGLVQQTTAASPSSVSVGLLASGTVDAGGALFGAQFHLDNSYSLAFTLTTASLMHVTVQQTDFLDYCYSLYGPNSFYLIGCLPAPSLDQSFIVPPGAYALNISGGLISQVSPEDFSTHEKRFDDFSLTADFTTVPEPRWSVVVAALVCSLCLVLRQRGANRSPSLAKSELRSGGPF